MGFWKDSNGFWTETFSETVARFFVLQDWCVIRGWVYIVCTLEAHATSSWPTSVVYRLPKIVMRLHRWFLLASASHYHWMVASDALLYMTIVQGDLNISVEIACSLRSQKLVNRNRLFRSDRTRNSVLNVHSQSGLSLRISKPLRYDIWLHYDLLLLPAPEPLSIDCIEKFVRSRIGLLSCKKFFFCDDIFYWWVHWWAS